MTCMQNKQIYTTFSVIHVHVPVEIVYKVVSKINKDMSKRHNNNKVVTHTTDKRL